MVVKNKPGEGALNRLIKMIKSTIVRLGHVRSNFSRDYNKGIANYVCSECGGTALVMLPVPGSKIPLISGRATAMECNKITMLKADF